MLAILSTGIFGKFKLIAIVLGVVVILAAAGVGYKYITDLRKENVRLHAENVAVGIENTALKDTVVRKNEELEQSIQDNAALQRQADAGSRRIKNLRAKLESEEHKNKLRFALEERSGLVLRYLNNNTQCYLDNLDKGPGECVAGKWRPIGNEEDNNDVSN